MENPGIYRCRVCGETGVGLPSEAHYQAKACIICKDKVCPNCGKKMLECTCDLAPAESAQLPQARETGPASPVQQQERKPRWPKGRCAQCGAVVYGDLRTENLDLMGGAIKDVSGKYLCASCQSRALEIDQDRPGQTEDADDEPENGEDETTGFDPDFNDIDEAPIEEPGYFICEICGQMVYDPSGAHNCHGKPQEEEDDAQMTPPVILPGVAGGAPPGAPSPGGAGGSIPVGGGGRGQDTGGLPGQAISRSGTENDSEPSVATEEPDQETEGVAHLERRGQSLLKAARHLDALGQLPTLEELEEEFQSANLGKMSDEQRRQFLQRLDGAYNMRLRLELDQNLGVLIISGDNELVTHQLLSDGTIYTESVRTDANGAFAYENWAYPDGRELSRQRWSSHQEHAAGESSSYEEESYEIRAAADVYHVYSSSTTQHNRGVRPVPWDAVREREMLGASGLGGELERLRGDGRSGPWSRP